MIWVFLFLIANIVAEEGPTPSTHFEGALPCVVGGCVHVMTGAPLVSETDLVIPGVEPLVFKRRCHYAPQMACSSNVSSWDFPLDQVLRRSFEEGTSPNRPYYPTIESEDFSFEEDSQAMFLFRFPKGRREDVNLNYIRFGKGVTNIARGYPSGKTNLYNSSLLKKKNGADWCVEADLVFGNGEVRNFLVDKPKDKNTFTDTNVFTLQKILTPNGFQKRFRYDHTYYLDAVFLESPTGKPIGKFEFKEEKTHSGSLYEITADDGRSVSFERTFEHHTKAANRCLIHQVSRTDFPSVNYEYHPSDKNKQLTKISYPEGRGVTFDYWGPGDDWVEKDHKTKLSDTAHQIYKVKSIQQPVGPTKKRLTTHFIQYFMSKERGWKKAHTRVTSSCGHVDEYFFDDNFLLQEVRHYTNPEPTPDVQILPYKLDHTCDQRERFFWNEKGKLKTWALRDGAGIHYQIRHYLYDDRGNVLEENTYGNYTGKDSPLPAALLHKSL
jgi:hypothetical protein